MSLCHRPQTVISYQFFEWERTLSIQERILLTSFATESAATLFNLNDFHRHMTKISFWNKINYEKNLKSDFHFKYFLPCVRITRSFVWPPSFSEYEHQKFNLVPYFLFLFYLAQCLVEKRVYEYKSLITSFQDKYSFQFVSCAAIHWEGKISTSSKKYVLVCVLYSNTYIYITMF